MPDGTIAPYAARLSLEAESLCRAFAEHIEQSPDGELESLKEWASKLPGNMLRLAGLLHFWAEARPLDSAISGQTMNTAIILAAVMVEHCKAAFAFMGADEKLEAAKRILAWIKKPRPEPLREFSARDCWRGVRGSFEHMAEVQAGLDILEDRSFIAEFTRDSSGPGRPSRLYQVNPDVIGGEK